MSSADGSSQAGWAPDQQKVLLRVPPSNTHQTSWCLGWTGHTIPAPQRRRLTRLTVAPSIGGDTAAAGTTGELPLHKRDHYRTKSINGWWPDFGWLPHTMVSLWNRVFLSDVTENFTEISCPSSKDAIQMDLECLRGQGSQPAGQWGGREDREVWHRDRPDRHLPSSSGIQRFLLSFWSSREKKDTRI